MKKCRTPGCENMIQDQFPECSMSCGETEQDARERVLLAKREKLLSLLLLTDPAVSSVQMSEVQLAQHQAFLDAFPDERAMLEIPKTPDTSEGG